MSIARTLYEVRVKIGRKIRSFHYWANSPSKAGNRGGKHGRVVSVQKVDVDDLQGSIENMQLEPEEVSIGDFLGGEDDKLRIDELLGLRKSNKNRRSKRDTGKRNKRRNQEES